MLYGVVFHVKHWYNRGYETMVWQKIKKPYLFYPAGISKRKKTTTKNIARIGKHSELLAVTDDPLAYAKEQVAAYNEKARNNNKVTVEVEFDFSEKLKSNSSLVSSSSILNVGYFYLQQVYHDLGIRFFSKTLLRTLKLHSILTWWTDF